MDLARGLAGGQAQDLTYTRPDVEVEAEVLTGDLIRFIATVDAGDKAIEDGVTTDVLEPSESDPVVLDVQAHEVVIEEPEPQDPEGPQDPQDPEDPSVPSPDPGSGSGSWDGSSSSGSSSSPNLLASIFGSLASLGLIPQSLLDLLGWNLS